MVVKVGLDIDAKRGKKQFCRGEGELETVGLGVSLLIWAWRLSWEYEWWFKMREKGVEKLALGGEDRLAISRSKGWSSKEGRIEHEPSCHLLKLFVHPMIGSSGDKEVALHGQLEVQLPREVSLNSSRLFREARERRKTKLSRKREMREFLSFLFFFSYILLLY